MKLLKRLISLERSKNTAPMLTMEVSERPTAEQAALIDRCTKTGRRLVVFFMPDDSARMPGSGVPPWEAESMATLKTRLEALEAAVSEQDQGTGFDFAPVMAVAERCEAAQLQQAQLSKYVYEIT